MENIHSATLDLSLAVSIKNKPFQRVKCKLSGSRCWTPTAVSESVSHTSESSDQGADQGADQDDREGNLQLPPASLQGLGSTPVLALLGVAYRSRVQVTASQALNAWKGPGARKQRREPQG